jgi:transposase
MTEKELHRKTILEKAEEHRITQAAGATELCVSERHFRRLLSRHRKEGDMSLVSGHRGKPSNHRLKAAKRQTIIEFIHDPRYTGFGPTLLTEKLAEYQKITVSRETVRQIMIEEGFHHPKSKKKINLHPQRERRAQRGELVQLDGSYHAWLEERGSKACLLLFVDDATSEALAAEFVEHESYFSYGKLCQDFFHTHGLPVAFYSDKFSVFRVNSNHDAMTQFGRALHTLGINLICANSPQAKGRVERANKTFQDRLVKELRLQDIDNYQDANAFLPTFLQAYNRKFAVLPRSVGNAFSPLDTTIDLHFLFSIHDFRKISRNLEIAFNNTTYQIRTSRPPQNLIGREVLVTLDADDNVAFFLNSQPLLVDIFHKQPPQAQIASSKSLDYRPYAPPVNHPWRSYGKQINGKPIPIPDSL